MMCLLEVADLLRERQGTAPETIAATPDDNTTAVEFSLPANDCGDTENPLTPIIWMIARSMDAEKIFLLGSYQLFPNALGLEYDLFVLVKDTQGRPLDELESLIHNRSQNLAPVHATVYKLSKANELLGKGNYFFSMFCMKQRLVYDAGRVALSTPPGAAMNTITNARQRFIKPYHFLAKTGGHSIRRLREIFQAFPLDDFREELTNWQERALCNDKGSYDEAGEREDLIDFCQECLRLAEAMFVVQKKAGKKKKQKWKKVLSKESLAIIKRTNQLAILSDEEQADPLITIGYFCALFTPRYAKIEVLDLLEALVTYEGVKQIYLGNAIFFYQCLEYLIAHAFRMCRDKK